MTRKLVRRDWLRLMGSGLSVSAFGLASSPDSASAHPYHSTLTQARHNRSEGTLECSLRCDPEALQEALRRAGHPKLKIDTADEAALDRICNAYLRRRFIVCDLTPKRLPLSLIGHELDMKYAWLHFAFPVGTPAHLGGYHLEPRVFFEIAPAQVNRVQIEHGGAQQTLLFRADHPSELLSAPPKDSRP